MNYNPGGFPGVSGINGSKGSSGSAGRDGKAGKLQILVVSQPGDKVTAYAGIYNFKISSLDALVSPSGIIEPGQTLQLTGLRIKNIGLMPSVAHVKFQVQGNSFIATATDLMGCWILPEMIDAGQEYVHPHTRLVRILPELVPPRIGESLCINTTLEFIAIVPRTCKVYRNLCAPVPVQIRYPAQISLIQGGTVCVPGEMIPFTVVLRNVSRIGLGRAADTPRLLFVTVEVMIGEFSKHLYLRVGNSSLSLSRAASRSFVLSPTKYNVESPFTYDIEYLGPNSQLVLSGAFGLDPSCQSFYEQVFYRVTLHMGTVDNPLKPLAIQQQQYSFQITESFQHPPAVRVDNRLFAANCLLVIHCYTTKEEVSYWRNLLTRIGMTVCMYNVSLYRGLSYAHDLFGIRSNFQMVIILNNGFARDDNREYFSTRKMFHTLQVLAMHEMFDAVRHFGVRTYVINFVVSGKTTDFFANFAHLLRPLFSFPIAPEDRATCTFDGRNKVYKYLKMTETAIRDEMLPRRHIYCRIKLFRMLQVPTNDDYEKRIKEMSNKLNVTRPDRQYFL
jgi:hypothetical protein